MEVFKWGIIGPGNIAHAFADDLPRALSATHVAHAVLAKEEKDATEFSKKFNLSLQFTNLEEFIKKSGVDAVYIATPHVYHYEEAVQCLQNRIPVLCEKPITINARQLSHLIQLSAENNTFLLEGMWIRFLPSIQKILSLYANGVIGNIISIKADMSYKAQYDPQSRYFNPELGGGSLLDLGIYLVFLSTLLLGKPQEIKAGGIVTDSLVDGNCSALFTYKTGQTALVESSFISKTEGIATIYGDKGLIRIRHPWYEKPEGIDVEFYEGTKVFHKCEWEGKGLYFEVDEVYNCIAKGLTESVYYCHHFSLDVMQTLDEMRKQLNVVYPAYE